MRATLEPSPRTPPVIVKRRRAFGLDAPRTADPRRTERALLDWLDQRMPEIVPLRIAGLERCDGADIVDPMQAGLALALLLPRGGLAVLQIEGRSAQPAPQTLALLKGCLSRRVPVAVIRNVEEARAALRRFGFEPREA